MSVAEDSAVAYLYGEFSDSSRPLTIFVRQEPVNSDIRVRKSVEANPVRSFEELSSIVKFEQVGSKCDTVSKSLI